MVSRKQLSDDLSTLLSCAPPHCPSHSARARTLHAPLLTRASPHSTGLFQNVDANVAPSGAGYTVEFSFREKVWPPMMQFKVSGSTILPDSVEEEVLAEARKSKYTTVRVLAAAKNIVEAYYQERGLTFGTISHFDGMETGQVIAHIIEGEITRVNLVYLEKDGSTSPFGSTNPRVVTRELPFRPGQLYNVEDAKRALRDIFQLQLFDNVQVVPKPAEEDAQKVEVDIVLRERPLKTAEVEAEWGVSPGEGGRPELVSLVPGGSVFFEHRNLDKEGRQLYGSVSTANFLAPQDDLGFKVEYIRPYCWGEKDPARTALKVSAFNSRKLSPVFTGGPLSDEVPGVWVDRAGVKAAFTERYSRQSSFSYGGVIEEVTTRDESGGVCAQGSKALPSGVLAQDGPPTTHSGTGTDRVAFAQANLTRDTTYFLNGVLVGARDIFTVDQALFSGTGLPFYNRHTASCTRFIQLRPVPKKSAAPPPVLVLHARYGGCVGSLASYDAFTLGGPYSCRGYNVGELGAGRRVAETAVELRLPVPRLNTHAYAFWEHASDLGSSKEVPGNPTAYYRRAGAGSCSGVGVKLGAVRSEWVRDHNQGTGALFVRFGERF
jgi:IAP75 family protein translocase